MRRPWDVDLRAFKNTGFVPGNRPQGIPVVGKILQQAIGRRISNVGIASSRPIQHEAVEVEFHLVDTTRSARVYLNIQFCSRGEGVTLS